MGNWNADHGSREARVRAPDSPAQRLRKLGHIFTDLRQQLVARIRAVNDTTSDEVRRAAQSLQHVVDCARNYASENQHTLTRMQDLSTDNIGMLLNRRSELLRTHAGDMSGRALAQDERARNAALTAKSIAELAISIERLAGETRLLAINARIESSRLGARSSGFSVLAAEMKRLSDEVAKTNERVSDLAGLLGQALPWIAQHARDVRQVMEEFSHTAETYLEETDRGVKSLGDQMRSASFASNTVIEELMRASQNALSHLQFQDVVAQDLRRLDTHARQAQLDALQLMEASQSVLSEVPDADYTTLGEAHGELPKHAPSPGDVNLF
ncbi:MAG: methyl-accepting chemotaxis protein [Polyangiales bacterium]